MTELSVTVNPSTLAQEATLTHTKNRYASGVRTTSAQQVSTIGNNIILTPAAGKKIRLHWVGFSSSENNTAEVLVIMKFGATGPSIYRWNMSAPGIFSHWETVEGAANETLIINLSGAQPVEINYTYEEI